MLDLTMGAAHGELVGAASLCPDMRPLATAGDVSASYLLHKLRGEGMCAGVRMPLGRTFLTPRELAIVEAWICGGAMND
jgi:hypothetical protein